MDKPAMNALQNRLAALRRRLRLVSLTRGLSLLLVTVIGGAALAGLLDWQANLPGLIRAVLLVGILGGASLVTWRWLLAPLNAQADDLTLALRVEEAYPTLNDSLASTVQFLQQPDSESAGSPSLRHEAVQRALRLAEGCDFTKVINRRGLRLTALSALLMMSGAVALFVWQPAVARTALMRLANPYGENDWPRATQLALEFRNRIAIGQPFLIDGKVTGVVPGKAVIEFEGLSSNREVKLYDINADAESKAGTFRAKLDMTRQTRPFRFRVRANDATHPSREGAWHRIEVAQPPRLAPLNGLPSPQLELHFPDYTELPSPKREPPGIGVIQAVAGTNVILRAAADRPIAQASVSFRPTDSMVVSWAMLTPLGQPDPLAALAAAVGGQAVWDRVPGTLEEDGQRFTIEFQPWVPGYYVLRLEDSDGLAKEYEYDLRVLPDPPPTVTLERPAGNQSVLASAEVFLDVLAEDEIFAVRSVYLEYRRKDKDSQWLDAEPMRLPLFDHQAVAGTLPHLLMLSGQPMPVFAPDWRLRPKRVQIGRRWSLVGLGQEGEIIVIQACADDFNNVVAHHTPGRSVEVELRIVGRQALAGILDEAQGKIQQDLLRIREWQEKALKKVIEAQQQQKATGKLRQEDVDGLVEAEQLQKQIQARVGTTKDEGLRAELRRLEQMIRDNRLPPSGARDRLNVMKAELERLAREHLPQIEPQITSARQKLGTGAEAKGDSTKEKDKGEKAKGQPKETKGDTKGSSDLAKARGNQEEVQKTLDDLLKYLDHWASTQEIKGELRAVLQEQRDLKAELEKIGPDPKPGEEQAQAAVRKVADFQHRLNERTQRLVDKMERVAQDKADKDPATAEMLDKAVKIAKDNDLIGEMHDTEEVQLRARHAKTGEPIPQLNRATRNQGTSIKTMEQMLQAMEEQRKDEVERLVKKQKEEKKNLDDLVERLEKLQKKVAEAKNIPNKEERKAALKKLAEEQRKLEDEVRKKARELARLQAPRAGKELAQAAEEMARAVKQLEDGEDPEDAQEQALERLEQAQEKLEQARNDAEDELAREQLARIADQIKGLKERQDAAMEESERLHKEMLKAGRWPRALVGSLRNHGTAQADLGKEAAGLAEKLKGAPVFEMLMKKGARAMDGAAQTVAQRVKKAVPLQEKLALEKDELAEANRADARTQKLQKEASRRLERLLNALKPELDQARQQPNEDEEGGAGGGQQGGKGIRAGDGIPPLAQLKALRDEQKEVRERTAAFAKQYPDRGKLTPEQRAELETIHAEQEELFRLFRELTTQANEGEKQ
jgi:hypothetical protein